MKYLVFLACIAMAIPVAAQDVFNVSGSGNCGGPGAGVTRALAAGTHYVTLSGAMSNWSSNGNNGGNTWITRIRVRDLSTGTDYTFASGGWQPTPVAAAASVAGMVFEFPLATAATVSFFFPDTPCGDNRGTVTVSLDDPVVPVASAHWGTIKSSYR